MQAGARVKGFDADIARSVMPIDHSHLAGACFKSAADSCIYFCGHDLDKTAVLRFLAVHLRPIHHAADTFHVG